MLCTSASTRASADGVTLDMHVNEKKARKPTDDYASFALFFAQRGALSISCHTLLTAQMASKLIAVPERDAAAIVTMAKPTLVNGFWRSPQISARRLADLRKYATLNNVSRFSRYSIPH